MVWLPHRHQVEGKSLSCVRLCKSTDQPSRPLCPWDSPGKNAGGGCHFLFQGIFPTQRSNPGLLYSHLSRRGSPASCYWEVRVQTPGAGCAFRAQPPLHTYHPGGRGSMLPSPHHSVGRIPVHPANGHRTHQGGRPWRQAVIQRKKPLRGLQVVFTALRQLQRKAFIAGRRILFQSYSPGPLRQNNRTLVSIYLSCLAHMYLKYI